MVVLSRPSRRTNLALLLLLAGAFVTGWLAFGVEGAPASRAVSVLHGVVGLGILVLAPWKTVIVRRGLRRRRRHALAVAFAVVVAVCLLAGVAHATLGPLEVAGVSALDVHVASAVAAVPLALLHVVRRPQRARASDLSRRTALRAIAVGGAAALGYGTLESVTSVARLPGAHRRATGSYEVGSGAPSAMPVTQWFTDRVPRIDVGAYELLVSRPDEPTLRIAYGELLAMTGTTRSAVLDCTGGWWAEQTWRAVRLDTLLGTSGYGSIAVRSVTGYTRLFPAEDASALLLATHVGGAPLSAGHGGPVRLVAPGRRGFWWVKWVERVSVEPRPWWLQSPFPLQ
ncbi:molybdopterin-dependent oxidoreductase [Terrabacter sp. MAHUQ-38]|jgi:DMSO/TMAO reductase YedYZ molybdopterin-dependent catalytic subunit|uniref:molybdopterin-dependent oxidoreductase n=1 Tax=unclassified Terrabacter TaxID=2630222 RepID=UPI00165D615F|nr:molybdopterin-dependent oxidoreductase [Terrabacter sp. MAHUQ-38]MBC9820433.1 molybdopterin-dependent oxidoreductase [Terrabacter sp. MAHUQ-38]